MSSRGEELSDVQIYHPQEQVEVDAPDAAAGGAAGGVRGAGHLGAAHRAEAAAVRGGRV